MQAIGYFRTNAPPSQSEPVPSQFEFEEAFNEYCDLFFHQPVKTFGDLNASGSDAYPRYKDMVEYIGDSGTNYLIVIPNAGHIGADLESVARSFLELEGIGAKVTCDDEEYPDPLQNAFHILGVTGISKTRSAKIKESMQARALRGKGLGRPPFGYRNGDDGSLTIVKQEAPVVELIFRLYTKDGLGLRLIVQQLNERDIKTRRGGNWNMVSIRDMLRNPAYMGTYSRFGLRLPKAHEPIIPPPVYREAQDTTRSRRPVGRISSAEPFLLSGLAQCGYCGNKMMGVTRRQSWRNKDGKRQRRRCWKARWFPRSVSFSRPNRPASSPSRPMTKSLTSSRRGKSGCARRSDASCRRCVAQPEARPTSTCWPNTSANSTAHGHQPNEPRIPSTRAKPCKAGMTSISTPGAISSKHIWPASL